MNIKERMNQASDKLKVKKAEREQKRLQRKAEAERIEEERLAAERAALEAEKQRLLALNDKELMVELVFAVRGFYARMAELEARITEIDDDIESLASRISELEDTIETLRSASSDSTD